MMAFVLLCQQALLPEAEERSQTLCRALIDAALACGGRYYLPYRLHATPEQFQKAYPRAADFFERKRRYDPENRFQNLFSLRYGPR
jgi:FAD/FMN-containing dehydrogenase